MALEIILRCVRLLSLRRKQVVATGEMYRVCTGSKLDGFDDCLVGEGTLGPLLRG